MNHPDSLTTGRSISPGMRRLFSADEARQVVSYDPGTGVLRWKCSRQNQISAGEIAGRPDNKGHVCFTMLGCAVKAHRVAWLLTYGQWPERDIDHINGVKCDNRIANLRLTNASENAQNRKRPNANNRSGFLGVSVSGKRYRAVITAGAAPRHLGYYETAELAHAAYLAAKRLLHPAAAI